MVVPTVTHVHQSIFDCPSPALSWMLVSLCSNLLWPNNPMEFKNKPPPTLCDFEQVMNLVIFLSLLSKHSSKPYIIYRDIHE